MQATPPDAISSSFLSPFLRKMAHEICQVFPPMAIAVLPVLPAELSRMITVQGFAYLNVKR
jgi:hypothetical protein